MSLIDRTPRESLPFARLQTLDKSQRRLSPIFCYRVPGDFLWKIPASILVTSTPTPVVRPFATFLV